MKRKLALAIAMLLMIGTAASAFAYDLEITFRDIPWGSSIEEVRLKLDELYGDYDAEQAEGSGSFILDSDGEQFGDWYSCESRTTTLFVYPKDAEALGYPLESIRFVFAKDGDENKLITVVLRPKAPDLSGKAFDQMVGTFADDIISQYGEPEKNNSSQFVLAGGGNTGIYMYKGMDEFLWYGQTDAAELLGAAGNE